MASPYLFGGLKDHHVAALLSRGKLNGARPFLQHARVMIELRHEAERRGITTVAPAEQHYRSLMVERVYREMDEEERAK